MKEKQDYLKDRRLYYSEVSHEAITKAIEELALEGAIIILSNTKACMTELRKYILNNNQVLEQMEFMIDKHAHAEEYEQCEEYKKMKSTLARQNHHLKRILQGLPAFEETKTIIDETKKDIK